MKENFAFVCPYCGEFMDEVSDDFIKKYGEPPCCGLTMLKINVNKLFALVKGLEKLKERVEKEIVKGSM